MKAALKDNPRISIRFNVNDFSGTMFNGRYPQEVITTPSSVIR